MLFYSFFKSLVGKDVVVELKNDLSICGTLHSVDQYLNIKLTDISVTDPDKYPHMLSVKNCFIRGSVVRWAKGQSHPLSSVLIILCFVSDMSSCLVTRLTLTSFKMPQGRRRPKVNSDLRRMLSKPVIRKDLDTLLCKQ